MQHSDTRIALAGDLILTRPWSEKEEPKFVELIEILRNSDITIANLETLIHSFKGFPENNNQGPHMTSDPIIAREIKWAGINMLSGATNHANDYGVIGTLENIQFIKETGIQLAGVGKDLQEARSPAYYNNNPKVALLSATSTFDSWAKASFSLDEVAGRPGINPISVQTSFSSIYKLARFFYKALMKRGVVVKSPKKKNIQFRSKNISLGREFKGKYIADESDIAANLELIRRARVEADVLVFSFHSHEGSASFPPDFVQRFAHQAIDAGLDIFFSHGPHYIKGIEIYKDRPVFYGLGNLAMESQTIAKLPSCYYDRLELDYSLSAEQVLKITEREFNVVPKYWESILPVVRLDKEGIAEISIYPISLGFGKPATEKGTPALANQNDGEKIIKRLRNYSAPYNTKIEYNSTENVGVIRI